MKTRTDSTPLSIKTKVARAGNDQLFEFAEEVDDPTEQGSYTTIEYSEFDNDDPDAEPAMKKQKTYQKPLRAATISDKQEENVRTIEYTLINDDTSEVAQLPEERAPHFVEYHESETSDRSMDKFKRRSKGFGKYISALLTEITDDRIFFELQSNITRSIHEACIKQQGLKKS